MVSQSTVPFKIEDDVLVGEEDSIDDKNINIGELILNAFKSRPDFIGQVDAMTAEENTFQQMRERSVKCALWMKKLGVRRNDIVTIYTSNHLDTYIPYLATLYIGSILGVWHESRTINLLYYLQSSPKVIFTDVDKASTIFNVAKMMKISTKIVVFEKKGKKKGKKADKEEEEFESVKSILNGDFDETEIDEFSCTELESSRDTAVILFSSGTIDVSRKHVTIPHAFFTSPSNQQTPIMSSNDVGLWVESLHWNISLLLTVRAILSYVKAVKINNLFNPSYEECFCNIIQKYKVTWAFLKISMGRMFSKFKVFEKYDVSSLKQLLFGGRKPNIDYNNFITALPHTSVSELYCLPEIGVIAYKQRELIKINSSGYVSKTVRLLIADCISASPLKAYFVGVIWCKSPSLTNGYFNSTTGTLMTAIDNNGWFHTDDVGYYDSNGDIYILDRFKDIIRFRNVYFFPSNIEKVLINHPDVLDVAVIPIFNTFDGHHPLAFVVRKEGLKVTEKELIEFVAKKLDDPMHLRAGVLFRTELKYLNGHLDRRTLCKWAKDDLRDKEYFSKKLLKKENL
ncbi:uncharacterized protein [Anoplolepis gracilipes]|uniref:uncharacterized protein isoform X1 n=1 Tax=Anoplolepis gracilipes TaxID=354296 RepID=UPI003B9FB12D